MSREFARWVTLGVLVPCLALIGSDSHAGCPPDAETVNISVAGDEITIPEGEESVTIYLDASKGKAKVCWVVSDLEEGYTLILSRKSTTNGTGYFPNLKRKFKGSSGGPVIDRVGIPKKNGDWHYGIKLKKSGSLVNELDPTIIILGGSSRPG